MKRKGILLCVLMNFIILFTGCWNARELTSLSIATAISIDKSKDGYLVAIQLMNPREVAGETPITRVGVTTYKMTGKNVFEAIRKLTKETPRKIYFSHLQLLVLGEELAKDGIGKVLDFFSRDHELRTDFPILIAKNIEAEKVLNILTPMERIPATKIHTSVERSEKAWGSSKTIKIDELISNLVSEGKNPVLTGIVIKGDSQIGSDLKNLEKAKPPTSMKLTNIAIFKKDKLIGWLNESESIVYNYIMDNLKSTLVTLSCEDEGNLGIEIIKTKAKIKGKVENEKPEIEIKIQVEGNVAEVGCKMDLSKANNIYKLEEQLEKKIKRDMETVVEKVQKDFKSDIFGFGEVIRRADPKTWKELKNNWDTTEFVDLPVDIQVTAKIPRLGTVSKSFLKD